ncbi:hypothetical protein N656DRAFT_303872 [Canariomyces notabilis]|uniref:C2H2-type domain-containing protein n=1 Tax=Canariomyces notabilis TaxID=2074819 RepID=A0AAN6T9J2_9PEZI|nr:hypothetical protein N656DRAFT_303872 [Canariomyces arenarius]
MGHSGPVFENDYQTAVVRANLAAIAFGPKAVRRDETLFNDLRSMTLTRDEGAPIKVSEAQIAKFRERKDIAKIRDEIQHTTDKLEKSRLRGQIRSILETCKRLQLEQDRQAYFKEADRLRLQGLEPTPTPGMGGPGTAAPVAACLSRWRPRDEGELPPNDTSASEQYVDAQLLYLSSTVATARQRASEAAAPSESQQISCCFACFKGYPTRSGLTRHFQDTHLDDGTFDNPFACPPCRRAGAAEVIVHGPAEWCNHLEHTHGLIHTPRFNRGASYRGFPSNSPLACLLCEEPMASMNTLLAHMNRTEIPRYRKNLRVDCGACTREGQVDVEPMSIWEWLMHARAVHNWALPHVAPCPLCGHLCTPGRGHRRHLAIRHSDKLGEQSESAAPLASAMPAGEMQDAYDLEDLLRRSVGKHLLGQSAADIARRKRKRDGEMDGEYTAPAAKRTKGDGDGKCLALAARRTESDGDKECPPPPAKRKRAARHNVAYKELSPIVIDDADSDLCLDVITCASTVDEQQPCHVTKDHMGSSAALDLDFLGHIDPAILAPWRPANAAHNTAAVLSDYQTQEALRRPRRRRGRCHG